MKDRTKMNEGESLVVDGRSDASPAQLDAARAASPKAGQFLMNAEKARDDRICRLHRPCTTKNETCIGLEFCVMARCRKIIINYYKIII